jgi:hypothetical protein
VDGATPQVVVRFGSKVLGHSTIVVTQRYAHLGPSTVRELAGRTGEGEGAVGLRTGCGANGVAPKIINDSDEWVDRDSNPGPTG